MNHPVDIESTLRERGLSGTVLSSPALKALQRVIEKESENSFEFALSTPLSLPQSIHARNSSIDRDHIQSASGGTDPVTDATGITAESPIALDRPIGRSIRMGRSSSLPSSPTSWNPRSAQSDRYSRQIEEAQRLVKQAVDSGCTSLQEFCEQEGSIECMQFLVASRLMQRAASAPTTPSDAVHILRAEAANFECTHQYGDPSHTPNCTKNEFYTSSSSRGEKSAGRKPVNFTKVYPIAEDACSRSDPLAGQFGADKDLTSGPSSVTGSVEPVRIFQPSTLELETVTVRDHVRYLQNGWGVETEFFKPIDKGWNAQNRYDHLVASEQAVPEELARLQDQTGILQAHNCGRVGVPRNNSSSPNSMLSMPKWYADLIAAVQSMNIAYIRDFLANSSYPSVVVNLPAVGGQTLLHRAARSQQKELVQLLLDCGANPRICDADGKTPLHDACWAVGDNSEVISLLARAAPEAVNASDKYGATPLDYIPKREHGIQARYIALFHRIHPWLWGPQAIRPEWEWENPSVPQRVNGAQVIMAAATA